MTTTAATRTAWRVAHPTRGAGLQRLVVDSDHDTEEAAEQRAAELVRGGEASAVVYQVTLHGEDTAA